MSLNEVINRYVEEKGVSKDALANSLGISRSSFFNKVNGRNEFSLSEAFKVSRMLGISIDQLYSLVA